MRIESRIRNLEEKQKRKQARHICVTYNGTEPDRTAGLWINIHKQVLGTQGKVLDLGTIERRRAQ